MNNIVPHTPSMDDSVLVHMVPPVNLVGGTICTRTKGLKLVKITVLYYIGCNMIAVLKVLYCMIVM